ncbi:hypothetical protein [Streptomyces sp. NPDC058424]|uniref:hypothetical protein n=1 Tax=Streptomyces sp. NPDC058424 TaxID=3346491 RepID=UPI003668E598
MPKKQSTAAKKARQRQAETGEKYTKVLRQAQAVGPVRFQAFSAEGPGWAPIIERAGHKLKEAWPEGRMACWGEKFGNLQWRPLVPFDAIPREAWQVYHEAARKASVTCQTCPSPGRKRVVYTWDDEYGWVMPWVKTCCDACYHLPDGVRENWDYRHLAEQYEQTV